MSDVVYFVSFAVEGAVFLGFSPASLYNFYLFLFFFSFVYNLLGPCEHCLHGLPRRGDVFRARNIIDHCVEILILGSSRWLLKSG